jgi:hypothetical protein
LALILFTPTRLGFRTRAVRAEEALGLSQDAEADIDAIVEQISKIGLDDVKFDRNKSQPSVAVRTVQMTLAGNGI